MHPNCDYCDRPVESRGMCTRHYHRYRRGTLAKDGSILPKTWMGLPVTSENIDEIVRRARAQILAKRLGKEERKSR